MNKRKFTALLLAFITALPLITAVADKPVMTKAAESVEASEASAEITTGSSISASDEENELTDKQERKLTVKVGTKIKVHSGSSSVNSPYGERTMTISDKGIEIYWKKPEDVDGYEVLRSYGNGYRKVKTVTVETSNTCFDTSFDKSVSVIYYRVRSYKIIDNKKVIYSKPTAAFTANRITALTIDHHNLYLRSGDTRTISVSYGWGNARQTTWSSSNSSIAKVSSKGKVTGVKKGICHIRCYCAQTNSTVTCRVVVDRSFVSKLKNYKMAYTLKNGIWVKNKTTKNDKATIMITGDMMATCKQQKMQGRYPSKCNFNESFAKVKHIISSADLAVGNLEGVYSPGYPYMKNEVYINNKPNCNTPNRYLDALVYAGFDGVTISNNHNCDAGIQGILDTIKIVRKYKLGQTGIFENKKQKRYLMYDVNGIKVGFLAYNATPYNNNDINFNFTENDMETYLHTYSKSLAEKETKELRDAGCDYIIVKMHWGVKNYRNPTPSQEKIMDELADMDINYIAGDHPHIIQEYKILHGKYRDIPCYTCLGDFSTSLNQIKGNRDSVILRLDLVRDENGEVQLKKDSYYPCYTYTKLDGKYYVTVCTDDMEDRKLAARVEKRIRKATGDEISRH